MAKFIILPYGQLNPDTKKEERAEMLVNCDRIISIKPFRDYMCKVTLAGGNVISVWRRFDTLADQITNGKAAPENVDEEEILAAYEEGYAKCLEQQQSSQPSQKQLRKEMANRAAEWFETHPLTPTWKHELKVYLNEEPAEKEEPVNETI